ncbi:hypothetical protein [Cystobacter ferrugineus]|uniref:Metallothionein n=1 Tax=Cystobacter ferrugineus TaxID=83449 RepID=A0A1L9BF74_9BACT|nr:hypothetical protein [Cystobacter ferrugineus]OJH40907.1 hypothetical protein BON30_08265 [Cystobacter ferrugineus]
MSVRTLLLVLSTTTLSVFTGCATGQTAARADTPAASTSPEEVAQGEFKACGCLLHAKAEDGSAQAAAGRGCQCPHCSHGAIGSAGKGPSCGCLHNSKGDQAQVREGVP